MFTLNEVVEHFKTLDKRAKYAEQIVTIQDLDRIDWLIEQVKEKEILERKLNRLEKERWKTAENLSKSRKKLKDVEEVLYR